MHCPQCGKKGKAVDLLTVKALLARSLMDLTSKSYRFCAQADCSVVYFATDGSQVLYEEDVRERVFQKHPEDPDVFVCYCFRYTVGAIHGEVQRTGQSTAPDEISAGVKAGKCGCEVRNPQGSCCLGNVRSVVKRAQADAPLSVVGS